ncbi:MAG: ABC transporter permease [Thermomicrobiales bacterium]|nr:ABC transporter permease [Thermomicrobiales bacterium]
MAYFILNRILHAAAVLFGVVSLTFLLLHLGGDPLAGLVPPGASPEVEAQLRHAYGLDRPLPEQYATFVGRAMVGDFGESWRQGRPALTAVLERLPATIELTVAATVLSTAVGCTLGVLAAAHEGSAWDWLARTAAILGQAIPAFWLGAMLILVFAVRLHWLPASGMTGPAGVLLPALALAACPAATLTRLVRAAMIDNLRADYVRTARAKGLPERAVMREHALRNAALPALAYAGLQAGFLFGGAVIVEGVFAYPGIGSLALDAVFTRDVPLVEAFVWIVAILILVVNTGTALLATTIDPRLALAADAPGTAS